MPHPETGATPELRTQIIGLALVAVGVVSGLLFVVRFLFDSRAAMVISGSIVALIVLLWLVRPLIDQRRAQ